MYQRLLYGVMGALMVGCVCAWGPRDGCAHTMSPNMPSSEEGAEELMPPTGQMPCMPSVLTPDSPKATLHRARGGFFSKKKWEVLYGLESRKSKRNDRKNDQKKFREEEKQWIKKHQHQ